MPTYEYFCTECGFEFEEFQSIASDPLTICPKCDGSVQRKISGGSGLLFKGSGFYITDYKNNNNSGSDSKKSDKKPNKPKAKAS